MIRKLIREVLQLMRRNLRTLAMFEILYTLFTGLAVIPAGFAAFRGLMQLTGYRYLTAETLPQFLLSPISIIVLLVLALAVAAVEAWHLCTVVCILDRSRMGKRVGVVQAVRCSFRHMCHTSKRGLSLMAVYLLFMMPFMGFGTGVISTLALPEFIMDSIQKNALYTGLLIGAYILISVFLLRWIYSIHIMILDQISFLQAVRKSAKLFSKHWLRDILLLLLVRVLVTVVFALVVIIGVVVLLLLGRVGSVGTDILMSGLGVVFAIGVTLALALNVPMLYATIGSLFYTERESTGEPVTHIECAELKQPTMKHRIARAIACVLVIAVTTTAGTAIMRAVRHGDLNLNIDNWRTTEVTAHRGASAFYPENTMAAFRGASEQGADWAELDVQQSSDGVIFVLHDIGFGRTTGVYKSCWEMTWEEISKLDAGSFFSKDFAGERIPTLQEVIDFAKESGIRLNIELKPTGHETDFEKQVVDIINESDFADSCVVTSQVYEVLENIKAYDPELTTVYVMAVAVGEIETLECADDFSIEATFVTEELTDRLHALGKQVYAWTVDSEESIDAMIEAGADNIITNNVPLAKQRVAEARSGGVFTTLMNLILGKDAEETMP